MVKPKTGVAGLIENWRSDLFSGFLVFLLALPLCLGVAVASGFPPAAGIISAVIGGLLVSRINGSYVTVNGPAAGLIVVVYAAVQSLGEGDALAGYRYTLAAIVVASVFQFLLGFFRAGRFSAFFPASVVHGMLAAIGLIIIAKQSHVMLGVSPEPGNVLSLLSQLPHSLLHPQPQVAIIGISGLLVLGLWPRIVPDRFRSIPAPMVVLLLGILIGQWFGVQHEHLHLGGSSVKEHAHLIGPEFLVQIPDDFLASFYFPDFSKLFSTAFWGAVISICLVGSLESLLSAAAVDRLDPYQRTSDLDRDLSAIGLGNFVAGMVGGLPLIAEIVRSSANVDNGAKTAWANFFHGLILLLFVVLFPHVIHNIPLATLAVLLVYTGYRLASPRSFRQALDIGVEQLAMFVITIIGVLATNLLFGVLLGIVAKLVLHLLRGVWLENMFKIHFTVRRPNQHTIVVKIIGSALFCNFLPLKTALAGLENGKTIVFNLTDGYLIDHTVMDFFHDFGEQYAAQGGHCVQIGHALETFSDHQLAARVMTEDDRRR